MNELELVQEKIEGTEKQTANLKNELADQKDRLDKAIRSQQDSILHGHGKNAENIEYTIINLQTQIRGTNAALETLSKTLQDLQTEKKSELNKIRIAQAEQMRDDIRGIFKDIYLLLAELVNKVKALDAKRVEYKTLLRANDQNILRQFSERTAHVKILLVSEISNILSGFEYDLFDKKDLPTPQSLKRSMRS